MGLSKGILGFYTKTPVNPGSNIFPVNVFFGGFGHPPLSCFLMDDRKY